MDLDLTETTEAIASAVSTPSKQAVVGFGVANFTLRKTKDNEKVRLVLEANVDAIGAGSKNLGDVLKALADHATGEVEVGLSLFMK